MSLFEGAKTRIGVNSKLSEEFEVRVGMHQGSVLSPFIFAVVVDVVTELVREGVLSELLYADDLILMNDTFYGHRDMFLDGGRLMRERVGKLTLADQWWSMSALQSVVCTRAKLTHVWSAA